jgi:hypothetical protein
MNILAFFTNSGIPAVGLSPTIKIRDVLTGALIISGANMTETGDGFYYYSFVGYEYETDYAIVCDGTDILPDVERYVFAGNENYIDDVESMFDTNATLSGIQEDLNNPSQYMADVSGLAPTGEYGATLSGIQADLDNPNQYKATGFAVSADIPTVSEIDTELINNHGVGSWTTGSGLNEQVLHDGLDTYINKDNWKAAGFSVPEEYDATLSGIQADLDNPDQYKANISALALESTTIEIKDQTDQLHFSGDNVQSKVADKGVLNDLSAADVDNQLSSVHGSGDWDQVATVSGLEAKLDIIQTDLDNPDQYKADVSGLALETTVSGIEIGLSRVLGLVQENYHLDQMTYTVYQETNLLTSGRVRVYSDAASVGTDSNVLAVYDITASYDGDKLQTYKVVKQ